MTFFLTNPTAEKIKNDISKVPLWGLPQHSPPPESLQMAFTCLPAYMLACWCHNQIIAGCKDCKHTSLAHSDEQRPFLYDWAMTWSKGGCTAQWFNTAYWHAFFSVPRRGYREKTGNNSSRWTQDQSQVILMKTIIIKKGTWMTLSQIDFFPETNRPFNLHALRSLSGPPRPVSLHDHPLLDSETTLWTCATTPHWTAACETTPHWTATLNLHVHVLRSPSQPHHPVSPCNHLHLNSGRRWAHATTPHRKQSGTWHLKGWRGKRGVKAVTSWCHNFSNFYWWPSWGRGWVRITCYLWY